MTLMASGKSGRFFAVIKSQAEASLLDSYEAERLPVAQANSALSVANWHEATEVPSALGLNPAAASVLQRIAASGPASMLPRGTLSHVQHALSLPSRTL